MRSERNVRNEVYDAIVQEARPGDIVFMITIGFDFPKWQRVWRRWTGQDDNDASKWHTAVYSGCRKERRSAVYRPYIVHSAEKGSKHAGTTEEHISPSYYTCARNLTTVLEIIRMNELDADQRARIVDYARHKIGTPHDTRGWQRDFMTYVLGLPVVPRAGTISCHTLAFEAYGAVGVDFPHQTGTMPWFNPARWTGHPVGHSRDKVNLHFAYLRDHHFYNDSRFSVVLSVCRDKDHLSIVHHPEKYSWRHSDGASQPAIAHA